MGRFTDNCRKEQFFIACGKKGWIYDEEKAFLDLIYDLAKVNNDPRLDGILENMVRSDMTVPEVRKAMIDEIKNGISALSPNEKMIAAVAAIKPEIDPQKLKKDGRVWRHDVLSALEDDMKEASKRAYKERFKEMDVRDFRGKCYFKGWGAEYYETSFLRNLSYAAQSLGDKRLFDLMDEILNTDISDPEKRSTFINDIKNRVSSMSFALENDDLVSMKKDMQKLDPVLNEERIKNIRDEQERETRRLKEEENKKRRTKLGEERDLVFIDTALKMGWKKVISRSLKL